MNVMCGIVGHIDFSKAPNKELVHKCVSKLKHRGPDNEKLWVSPDKTCILGHARLSIIDLSETGNQPMLDKITGNCVVFNGEIYNFQSLRQHCENLGEKFISSSDTEVILALYRLYGIDCLQRLRGMFAIALWDEKNKMLFISRDRCGKKPLNYYLAGGTLIFCSELSALTSHPEVQTEMDNDALELYLQLGYIPAPWTIFKKVKKLPPAHYAIFNENGLIIKRYWTLDYRDKMRISESDAIDGLEEKLMDAIKLRMISDVPIGALLSGGVDSSIVVALMSKIKGTPVNTYSIGFTEDSFNELPFAKQAADICGSIHYTETLNGNVAELLPKLIKHYGEPYADSSAVPSFFVCEAARRHVKVALNGDGGDELMGGYSRNWLSPVQLQIAACIPNFISASNIVKLAISLSEVEGILLKTARKILREYMWPDLAVIPTKNEFWNLNDRNELLGQNNNETLLKDWLCQLYQQSFEKANDSFDRMLYFENNTYLPGDLLVKMDIASMSYGLELRSPLLDTEVIEFCACLPIHYKVNNRIGKYLLKKLTEKYFPPSFVQRRKMGFRIPLSNWLKSSLRNSMEEVLRSKKLMTPFNEKKVEQTLNEFLVGRKEHSSRIWALYMYGLWNESIQSNS